ncbi:FAD-dependent oxidoreductase [Pseudomonas qingdaonensis]|nr:FAD-dependent oxidoreductase [Pseudomonas qingdaonensis]
MHDVLVVGAGPAGTALAIRLVQAGLQVGLVEREPEAALRPASACPRGVACTCRTGARRPARRQHRGATLLRRAVDLADQRAGISRLLLRARRPWRVPGTTGVRRPAAGKGGGAWDHP